VQTQPSTAHSPPPPPISTRAATNTSGIQIRPIAGALGAEISNIDLSSPLSAPDIASIRRALLSHLVIFFRNQPLPPNDFLKFTSHFGQPVEYPFVKGLDGLPEVIQILKREDEKVNFGGVWHSDTSYFDEPPMGSVLLAREVPPYGGDTLFANQYAAYEALSPSLQKTLSTLRGVNTSKKADASKTREDRIKDSGKQVAPQDYEASHPVVRTHPETGRKALYINIAHTARFEGWSEEESQPLLKYLFEWQVRPEFTCRFRWEEGSIAFWDNRCAQHNPINDYHGHRRLMHRITLGGDVPV
jgi:taurine dioxygenase